MKRILLVVNANARRGDGVSERAASALAARGHEVIELTPESPAELSAEIGRHRGSIDYIVLGGGDGTLISAIDGVRAAGVPLVILPLGTINELSRTLGLPFDVEAACALIDDGVPRAIDVGKANDCWFFNEASIGLSTHVAREQTGDLKKYTGMLAIPIATLRALRHMRPYRLNVTYPGGTRSFRTVQMTVANSHRFGGVVENRDAAIDDGQLDLYSIQIDSLWDAADVLAAVMRRRFPDSKRVDTIRATSFTVEGRHRHHVTADGEPAGTTPVTFSVVPRALEVMVPR